MRNWVSLMHVCRYRVNVTISMIICRISHFLHRLNVAFSGIEVCHIRMTSLLEALIKMGWDVHFHPYWSTCVKGTLKFIPFWSVFWTLTIFLLLETGVYPCLVSIYGWVRSTVCYTFCGEPNQVHIYIFNRIKLPSMAAILLKFSIFILKWDYQNEWDSDWNEFERWS